MAVKEQPMVRLRGTCCALPAIDEKWAEKRSGLLKALGDPTRLTMLAALWKTRQPMCEIGLDLSKEFPKPLSEQSVRAADVVVTMGCGDACPIYPGKRYLDWELPDPAGRSLDEVREIRDEIGRRVTALLSELTAV